MQSMIIRSLVEYPEFKDKFEERFSIKWFDEHNARLLTKVLSLDVISFEALESVLSEKEKQDEFFLRIACAIPTTNFLEYDKFLREESRLKAQERIGLQLISAYKNNQILDLGFFEEELKEEKTEIWDIAQWIEFYKDKEPIKIPSKISFLDRIFKGGFELGQLILISGDPDAGKTSLALQILENMSRNETKVCFFCFEFTIDKYIKRKTQTHTLPKNGFFDLINTGYDISEITHNIKLEHKKGVKVFLIDSQMRISSPTARTLEEEESLKFSTLAKLCHSLDIVIFLIVQTSKGDKASPMGSKKGAHEASIILSLELISNNKKDEGQNNTEYVPNKRTFLIRKNKQTGERPRQDLFFNTKNLYFYEFDTKEFKG